MFLTKKESGFSMHLPGFSLKSFFLLSVFLFLLFCLGGCSSSGESSGTETAKRDNTPVVLIPTADGTKTIEDSVITIDISNTSRGYIMAAYHGDVEKVNIQLTGPDGTTYLYFIRDKDSFTAMPLSSGDGTYLIDVYENVEGDIYSSVLSTEFDVSLENEFLPFLYANQFVFFEDDTEAITKGASLAADCTSDLEVISQIYNYVIENTSYDYEKAKNVTSPYYPDVDETQATGQGICFDYSALMCTMLRTQRIPAKLNIGYADGIYHAWISAYIDSIGWVDNIIQFNGTDWTMMDPTFASTEGADYDVSQENYVLMFQR